MSKGRDWFIIRNAIDPQTCAVAAQEISAADAEVQKDGYLEYKPTPTCIQIADRVHKSHGDPVGTLKEDPRPASVSASKLSKLDLPAARLLGREGELYLVVAITSLSDSTGMFALFGRHEDTFENQVAWLDGPFGSPYRLEEYSTVVLFASGSGIYAQLPLLKDLATGMKASAIRTRRVKLVCQAESSNEQLQEWMHEILSDEPDGAGVVSVISLSWNRHTTFRFTRFDLDMSAALPLIMTESTSLH
ncbi:hypothetical protein LTR09_012999 [Extremus antarcticus]|uniref:Ferric reductase NAD binding domain-containing protein n=1 Tax=Extremus antarcticus TaxID=702011 RepID=A0AAJ0D962_9PEZI|nr:hypothetical protein LTR09_012999 [Extremus antarcticus]